MIKPKNIQ